jgi:hypothetical protein
MYETSLFPDPDYTFKHALTLDVAYGSLLRERRRALHVRVLDALERLYADRLGEKVELLAAKTHVDGEDQPGLLSTLAQRWEQHCAPPRLGDGIL